MAILSPRSTKRKHNDDHQAIVAVHELRRETFTTSRLMDFMSEKELTAQIGHSKSDWPLVLLKELIDNALDACEESSVAPDITVTVDERGLTVADNGPGIPPEVVAGVIDYSVRISSREAYVSPCRGAQGNALKTVVAMPFVIDGERGHVTISARGIRHEITLRVDRIRQQPIIEHIPHEDHFVKIGTSLTVHSASSLADHKSRFLQNDDAADDDDEDQFVKNDDFDEGEADDSASSLTRTKSRFLQIADDFTFLNPHVSLRLDWFGERLLDVKSTDPTWHKWKPSDPTSPHWYEPEHFARLVSAYLSKDAGRDNERTVRELVAEFRGLSSTGKQKAVLDATGLHRAPLTALVNPDGASLDEVVLGKLLDAMKAASKPIKPTLLGIIGKEHLVAKFAALGCEMDSFAYHRTCDEQDGLPWIIEMAFAWCPTAERRRIITGVNFSPCILSPFRELGDYGQSLDTILANQRATADEPVVLLIHLTCPRVAYTDRGKSAIVIEGCNATSIIDSVRRVTKKWAKQRKAEERSASAQSRRRQAMTSSQRTTLKEAVSEHIEAAYIAVSDGGTLGRLVAHARQLMYFVRRRIQGITDEELNDNYFTQTLLPEYMRENPGTTAKWDVVFDARGHFTEPHTLTEVALGTLDVRNHLRGSSDSNEASYNPDDLYRTHGPKYRYGAILFIEKEGFVPLFKQVKLTERFDIGLMSTKGLSNIASRQLVDHLCGEHDIPLLVLHDFDKAGFSIVSTLSRSSDRYQFRHKIRAVDLGLRLADVTKWGLDSEQFFAKATPRAMRANLAANGATKEEAEFISNRRRVELNTFTSADLVKFIEGKLVENGVKKIIPDIETQVAAYRRTLKNEFIKRRFDELKGEADEYADAAEVPALKRKIAKLLENDPTLPWDAAVHQIACDEFDSEGSDA